jgi:hypothetical protein
MEALEFVDSEVEGARTKVGWLCANPTEATAIGAPSQIP